jgi:hypothetical protein
MRCFFFIFRSFFFALLAISTEVFTQSTFSKYLTYTLGECIGSGFKNIVLRLVERDDLVVRVCLVHGGYSVLKFRDPETFKTYTNALDYWINHYPNNSLESNVTRLLKECSISKGKNKDIVPRKDIEDEIFFERMSQSRSQLSFQVSGNLHRVEMPLVRTEFIKFDVSFVLEYNLKTAGDIQKLGAENLTENDMIRLLMGILNDQLIFKNSTGAFHIDGHAGNLLYQIGSCGEIYFIWSDFGKTTSSSSFSDGNQFQNSMGSVYNFLIYRSTNYPLLKVLISELLKVSNSFDGSFLLNENGIFQMKEITQKYILANYSQSFVENLIVKLSPVSRFGIQYLSERISVLEDKLDSQEKINSEQARVNSEQTSQIALLIKTLSDQAKVNLEQTSQIALLIKNNSEQARVNLEQTSQIALLIKNNSDQARVNLELTSQIALLIKNNSDQEIKIKILSARIENISNDQNKIKDNYNDHQIGDL